MGVLRVKVAGNWVDVGGSSDPVWVDPLAPSDPNVELWYDTDATSFASSTSGLEAARPAAQAILAGLQYYATDTQRLWLCDGTRWFQAGGIMPRFRLTGNAPGQSINSAWYTCNWGLIAFDPLALTSAGVFTCPNSHPGRWRFDYVIDIQAWAAGQRQVTLQLTGPVNYGYQTTTAVHGSVSNFMIGSAEIVVAAGQTVRAMAFQDAGTLSINRATDSYFQGQFVGPV